MKYKVFLLAFIVFITGCKNSIEHVNEHENEHKHEEMNKDADEHQSEHFKIQITAYTPDFELFAEADPFVLGHSSNILSHFSKLPDFDPLKKAIITLRLIMDGSEIIIIREAPVRDGIYSFDIKPESPGKASLVFEISNEEGNYEILIPDIMVYKDEHLANEAAEAAEALIPGVNTQVFTKEQQWKIDFATDYPEKEHFGQIIKTTAQFQTIQSEELLVSARTKGFVIFPEFAMLEGKDLRKGQEVFSISADGLAEDNAEVRFWEARNNYENATADYERHKILAVDKIVTQKELLDSKNNFANAKLVYDNLKNNFNANGQIVTSPVSGFVKQLFIKNGQFVEAGQPIFSIAKNEKLLLKAEVQQKYAPIMQNISSANIRSLLNGKIYSMDELNAKILSYGKALNDDNYLLPLYMEIDNKHDFLPGSFVELYLISRGNKESIVLPSTALLEEQGIYFVYVQVTPEIFEKREVKIGANDGLRTEITKGIKGYERIVTKGSILIKLAQSTGALDAHSGHVH